MEEREKLTSEVLEILLRDRTTGKNIIWATDEYSALGKGYSPTDEVHLSDITGETAMVMHRTQKSEQSRVQRSHRLAEVFTPSWICNKQNNLVDNAWIGQENLFNIETANVWRTTLRKIDFPKEKGKSWQDYVRSNRLEVACGEAPYLTSRYDAVSGEPIAVDNRIGFLDRKLRVVSENTDIRSEWYSWAKMAIQSVYGYDFQGDNVFLARENLLLAFIEYYEDRFDEPLGYKGIIEIANILAWNVWQMDGLKCVVPCSCQNRTIEIETLLGIEKKKEECIGCKTGNCGKHNGIYCNIYDWARNTPVKFYSLMEG